MATEEKTSPPESISIIEDPLLNRPRNTLKTRTIPKDGATKVVGQSQFYSLPNEGDDFGNAADDDGDVGELQIPSLLTK